MRRLSLLVAGFLLAAGCSGSEGESRTIVASIYPLAYAAERMAGPDWEVIDLTPPGVEAHDLELSLEQRSAIQDADVVLYLGDVGFQPQVERAVREANGTVVSFEDAVNQFGGFSEPPDPHFWVVPSSMRKVALDLGPVLERLDPETPSWLSGSPIWTAASRMHAAYHRDLEAAECRFRTMIVTHEAFGAFTLYDVEQFGLAGLTPEAEPSIERLAEARLLIDAGEAGAVFYEEHDEAKRIAKSFAADAGVPALPLSTLESEPAQGDYFTVMEDNLKSLREGLACP